MAKTFFILLITQILTAAIYPITITYKQLTCKSPLFKDKSLKNKTPHFLLRGEIVEVLNWHKSSAQIKLDNDKRYYIRKHHLSNLTSIESKDKKGNYITEKINLSKEKAISIFYEPNDLVEVKEKYKAPHVKNKIIKLRKKAYTAFSKMIDEAAKKNLQIKITSAYRTPVYQEKLYRSSIEFQMLTDIAIAAKPGHSEHQLGTAADVMVPGKNIRQSDEFKWIKKNARNYGIYLTYPKGNTKGYQWEPWHLRYWGEKKFKNYFSD